MSFCFCVSLIDAYDYTYSMPKNKKLVFTHRLKIVAKYYRLRSWYWQHKRLLFPSPAELRFIQIMGGKVLVINRLRHPRSNFPMAFVLSLGTILKRENVAREVRAGKCFIDFGADTKYYKKGIEIDGRNWHMDVVKEIERDEYVAQFGWRLLHIQAADLYRNSAIVQRRVIDFLKK